MGEALRAQDEWRGFWSATEEYEATGKFVAPPHPPKLPTLPRPILVPQVSPRDRREFVASVYFNAVKVRWPLADMRREKRWIRSHTGQRFLLATADVMHRDGIAPQAWVTYYFTVVSKPTMQPHALGIVFGEDVMTSRLEKFRTWSGTVPWTRPCQELGGKYAEAYEARQNIVRLVQRVDRELRAAELDGTLSMSVACRIVDTHLPRWRYRYSRIEATAVEFAREWQELVAQGAYLWTEFLK